MPLKLSVTIHCRIFSLGKVSGGDTIDRYFGISGGVPEQPAAEAAEGDKLIAGIREVSHSGGDLSALLGRIAQHNVSSGLDPDLLRALRQPRPKAE
ncbi:MAG: hypothetical protein RIS36_788 [Pseudomonadota bacterium]